MSMVRGSKRSLARSWLSSVPTIFFETAFFISTMAFCRFFGFGNFKACRCSSDPSNISFNWVWSITASLICPYALCTFFSAFASSVIPLMALPGYWGMTDYFEFWFTLPLAIISYLACCSNFVCNYGFWSTKSCSSCYPKLQYSVLNNFSASFLTWGFECFKPMLIWSMNFFKSVGVSLSGDRICVWSWYSLSRPRLDVIMWLFPKVVTWFDSLSWEGSLISFWIESSSWRTCSTMNSGPTGL